MAQPARANQPLVDVLTQFGLTKQELDQMLRDGADEAGRLIPKLLEKHATGGSLKAAQLALIRRELKVAQSALWGDLGRSIRQGVEAATLMAADNAQDVLLSFLGRHGTDIPAFRAAMREQAKQGIQVVLAKAKNGIPLARSVYKTQALAQGFVDRKVSQGLLLGHNAKTIAASVKKLINPDVAGGVSYTAHRLARTEINHAYQTSQELRYADEPWVTGMKWNLSKSHPKPDICNVLAERDLGDGPGVYKIGHRSDSHPNCLCYQTPEMPDEDAFADAFLAGEYNSYIDQKAYTYAPANELLCA